MAEYTKEAEDVAQDIRDNGIEIIYRSIKEDESYNVETGQYDVSYIDYETYAVRKGIKTQQMPTNYVQKPGDTVYLIGGLEIPNPSIRDRVICGGIEMSVFMFESVAPAFPVILYKIYVRGDVESND